MATLAARGPQARKHQHERAPTSKGKDSALVCARLGAATKEGHEEGKLVTKNEG